MEGHVIVIAVNVYMKVQIGLTSKTDPNLGEAILVPSQAHLCNTSAKGRAT